MMNESWSFWIILASFIGNCLSVFCYAGGYKRNVSWDEDLTGRLIGILLCIGLAFIYAKALGWW